jgi:hypothetical protein
VDYENGARGMLDLCMFAEGSRNEQEICVVGDRGKVCLQNQCLYSMYCSLLAPIDGDKNHNHYKLVTQLFDVFRVPFAKLKSSLGDSRFKYLASRV